MEGLAQAPREAAEPPEAHGRSSMASSEGVSLKMESPLENDERLKGELFDPLKVKYL